MRVVVGVALFNILITLGAGQGGVLPGRTQEGGGGWQAWCVQPHQITLGAAGKRCSCLGGWTASRRGWGWQAWCAQPLRITLGAAARSGASGWRRPAIVGVSSRLVRAGCEVLAGGGLMFDPASSVLTILLLHNSKRVGGMKVPATTLPPTHPPTHMTQLPTTYPPTHPATAAAVGVRALAHAYEPAALAGAQAVGGLPAQLLCRPAAGCLTLRQHLQLVSLQASEPCGNVMFRQFRGVGAEGRVGCLQTCIPQSAEGWVDGLPGRSSRAWPAAFCSSPPPGTFQAHSPALPHALLPTPTPVSGPLTCPGPHTPTSTLPHAGTSTAASSLPLACPAPHCPSSPPQTHARRYSHGGLIESAFATQAANAVLPPLWTLLHPVDSFSTGVLARAARTQVCCTQHSGRGWRWGLWRDGAGGVRRPWCGSGPCATRGRMPQQKSLSFWLQRGGGLFPWPSTHSANKQPWPANTSSTPPHRPHPTPPAVLCCGSA